MEKETFKASRLLKYKIYTQSEQSHLFAELFCNNFSPHKVPEKVLYVYEIKYITE
jgi:hypothetical protein